MLDKHNWWHSQQTRLTYLTIHASDKWRVIILWMKLHKEWEKRRPLIKMMTFLILSKCDLKPRIRRYAVLKPQECQLSSFSIIIDVWLYDAHNIYLILIKVEKEGPKAIKYVLEKPTLLGCCVDSQESTLISQRNISIVGAVLLKCS